MVLSRSDYNLLGALSPVLINCYKIVHDILPRLAFTVFTRNDIEMIQRTVDSDTKGNRYAVLELIEIYNKRAEDLKPLIAALKDSGLEVIGSKLGRGEKPTRDDVPQVDYEKMMEIIKKELCNNYLNNFNSTIQRNRQIHVGRQWVNLRIELPPDCQPPMIGTDPHEEPQTYWKALLESFPHDMFFIEGAKGYGKTTLVRRLAFDWAHNRLPNFNLVLFGRSSHPSIERGPPFRTSLDMVLFSLKELGYLSDDYVEFLKQYPFRQRRRDADEGMCLLVIDGFESATSECLEINEQLRSDEEHAHAFDYKLALLTVPRPPADNRFPVLSAQILPWTEDHVKRFVELFFDSKNEAVKAVMTFFKSQQKEVQELLSVPLYSYGLCCLERDGDLQTCAMSFLEEISQGRFTDVNIHL